MTDQKSFDKGMLAGMLVTIAASAGNWLITPQSHPDASAIRVAAVVAQAILCLGAALVLIVRYRRDVARGSAA